MFDKLVELLSWLDDFRVDNVVVDSLNLRKSPFLRTSTTTSAWIAWFAWITESPAETQGERGEHEENGYNSPEMLLETITNAHCFYVSVDFLFCEFIMFLAFLRMQIG